MLTILSHLPKYPRTVIDGYFDWDLLEYVRNNVDSTYIEQLIDQPDEIINASIGYDYKGFSGRLSMLHNDNVFVGADFWPELRQNDTYQVGFIFEANLTCRGTRYVFECKQPYRIK